MCPIVGSYVDWTVYNFLPGEASLHGRGCCIAATFGGVSKEDVFVVRRITECHRRTWIIGGRACVHGGRKLHLAGVLILGRLDDGAYNGLVEWVGLDGGQT